MKEIFEKSCNSAELKNSKQKNKNKIKKGCVLISINLLGFLLSKKQTIALKMLIASAIFAPAVDIGRRKNKSGTGIAFKL